MAIFDSKPLKTSDLAAYQQPLPKERLCNRTACQKPGATWWNPSTLAYYCQSCAIKINKHNPGLCQPPRLQAVEVTTKRAGS